MSPTIALKCRLDHGLKRHADPRTSMITSPYRSVSIGSEAELLTTSSRFLKLSTENEAANLLLSMSNIVSEEIKTNSCVFDDKDDDNNDKQNNNNNDQTSKKWKQKNNDIVTSKKSRTKIKGKISFTMNVSNLLNLSTP